jgi:hypothetical protein
MSKSTRSAQRTRTPVYEVSLLLHREGEGFAHLLLQDFEVSFLRLLEKVTNGTVIEISVTGAWFLRLTKA